MQQHEVGQTQGFWDVRYICGLVMRVRGGRGTMGADPHACRLVCVTEGTCTCGRRVGRGVYVPFAPTQAVRLHPTTSEIRVRRLKLVIVVDPPLR